MRRRQHAPAAKPVPAPLSEWAEGSNTRRVHVREFDGRVILRDIELSTSAHLYAVFPSTTQAVRAIHRDEISWRLDLEHARKRAETASKAAAQ